MLKQARNSSVELLKIFGMVLIVISHCIGSLTEKSLYVTNDGYRITDLAATGDWQHLLLTILSYSSMIGVWLFFMCSAWFWIESTTFKKSKIFKLLADVWTISILFLIAILTLRNGNVDFDLLVRSFFPTLFANNWYITCYILFMLIHPYLNLIIRSIEKKELFRIVSLLTILYVFANIYANKFFFPSKIILWTTIYFMIGYIKLYMKKFQADIQINMVIMGVAALLIILTVILKNYFSLHFFYMKEDFLFRNCNNPLGILLSISAVNVATNYNFKSAVINNISLCTLYIYIIHENILFRTYYRPLWWKYIYHEFGYEHIVLWLWIMVFGLFTASLLLGLIYKHSIGRVVGRIADFFYSKLSKIYIDVEKKLLTDIGINSDNHKYEYKNHNENSFGNTV